MRQSWSDGDHKDDTEIIFFTDELKNRDETLGYWFYSKYLEPAAEIKLRLYVFPLVVAHNGLDFLRLITIGYDEICWDENFSIPPNSEGGVFIVHPNVEFQQWIKNMFQMTISQIALELVTPTHMDDENLNDEFLIWINSIAE